MGDNNKQTTNRRNVLKTVSAGAIGTMLLAGAGSADHTQSDDAGIGAANCVDEWTEYRCVDSGCSCACGGCECDTKRQSRDCCEDSIGHTFCSGWTDTGNCCSSC